MHWLGENLQAQVLSNWAVSIEKKVYCFGHYCQKTSRRVLETSELKMHWVWFTTSKLSLMHWENWTVIYNILQLTFYHFMVSSILTNWQMITDQPVWITERVQSLFQYYYISGRLLKLGGSLLKAIESKWNEQHCFKVCLNRYSWGAGKVGSEYSSWFIRLECISWRFLTMSMQIELKMEAGDCPTLNMNAMENDLLSHSLSLTRDGLDTKPITWETNFLNA